MQVEERVSSRPVYLPVEKHHQAQWHVFVCSGDMPAAMTAVYAQCAAVERQLIQTADAIGAKSQIADLAPNLPLSTSVYVAGDEAFIWQVSEAFTDAGLLAEQIQLIEPQQGGRSVFCCHCYHVTDQVTHSPAVCGGCQRLAITGHFSRKNSSYFGFQINAEDPNDIPATEELSA